MNLGRISGLSRRRRMPMLVVGNMVVAGIVAAAVWGLTRDMGGGGSECALYTVSKSDLPIIVTAQGELESQVETILRCEVESLTRGGFGTQVIFLVPDGSTVSKGDLLVELDSAALRERLDEQTLRYQRAVAMLTCARARYASQLLSNQIREAVVALRVDLAGLRLQMYKDKRKGTYKLAVDAIERDISEQHSTILEKKAQVALTENEMAGVRTLFNLGYRAENDVDQVRLKLLRSQDAFDAANNNLDSFQAMRDKLTECERQMQLSTLEGTLSTSKRQLVQVRNNNECQLALAESAKFEAERIELMQKRRLDRYQSQLAKCRISAPHGGTVIHARHGAAKIAEGVAVYKRQRILSLPDLSRMQVRTQVHESLLGQVRPGLPATVRVSAFPDQLYYGFVDQVAVVPYSAGWFTSGMKSYDCVVKIAGEVRNLRPGMTAVVDIHVDRVKDALTLPMQAIVQRDCDNWCYVRRLRNVEKRLVKLGLSNDKFVQIQEGLAQGERIVLDPTAILERTEGGKEGISADAVAAEMR